MVRIATIALFLLVAGCTAPNPQLKHPLLDTVVDAASGTAVSRSTLLSAMSNATVVYLGEKHDNPLHHEQQLWVLRELIDRGHRPVLGFEIFSTTATSALMEYVSTKINTGGTDRATARMRAATGMQGAADERWSNYGALLQLAREHELTVFGIDLPIPLRRRVSRVGINGLTPMERAALPDGNGPDGNKKNGNNNDAAYRELMLARLKAAHCGHGSRAYLGRLFQNWQLRNETMARAITSAASTRGESPVLVIVGGGHVRNSEGLVPRVGKHMPDAQQLIVSFVEVDASRTDATQYQSEARTTAMHSSADEEVLWFTAASGLSMEDACQAFQHGKSKTSQP